MRNSLRQLQREQRGQSVQRTFLTCLKWLVSTLTNASLIWAVNHLNVSLDWFVCSPQCTAWFLESAGKWVWRAGKSLGGFGKERDAVCVCVCIVFYQMRQLSLHVCSGPFLTERWLSTYFNHWGAEWAEVNEYSSSNIQPLCSDALNTTLSWLKWQTAFCHHEHNKRSEHTTRAVNYFPFAVVWIGSAKLWRTLNDFFFLCKSLLLHNKDWTCMCLLYQ